jgi:hypothetical protein
VYLGRGKEPSMVLMHAKRKIIYQTLTIFRQLTTLTRLSS